MIDPKELIAKIRQSEQHRTPAQRFELLVKAGILDKDGYYSAQYFSEETVANDKAHNHIQIAIINPNCIKGIFLPRKKVEFP